MALNFSKTLRFRQSSLLYIQKRKTRSGSMDTIRSGNLPFALIPGTS